MQSDLLDSSSNGSDEVTEKNTVKKTTRSFASRRLNRLSTFGNSFSSHDLTFLYAVEEAVEELSEKDDQEEFSIITDSVTISKDSSSNSLECDAASSMTSTSEAEAPHNHHRSVSGPWRDFFRAFKKGPGVQNIPTVKKRVPKLTKWKSKKIREALLPSMAAASTLDKTDLYCLKPSWKSFSLSELQAATNDFSHENLIGQGGYAEVYKGQLANGQFVAIKKLTRGSPEEMTVDYLSEVGIIAHVDHPNIARLVGYGVEGGMHLVLELSPNGSLATLLYGPEKEKLDWGLRYKIALGTAIGLHYLHEECQRRIIHKDIKASNILLTEDFDPQISDFGLSKWLPDEWTHHTVYKIEGTFGYLPPEFFMSGIVDEKTDVYAYGVLLLELITGKQAVDNSQHSLVLWAKPLLENSRMKELADPALSDVYDSEQMDRVIWVASTCVNQIPSERPRMSQVVKILKGDEHCLEEVKQNQRRKHRRTFSEELVDAEDYNATKCLNDLNRHMEIVLGEGGSETAPEETHENGLK